MAAPLPPSGPGTFCWNQLRTSDLAGSKAFYEALLGWCIVEAPVGGRPAHLIHVGETVVGDLVEATQGPQAPPVWIPYVEVADVAEVASGAQARGATLIVPPLAIEGVGRLSLFLDPLGAVLGIFASDHAEGPRACGPGTFCWHERATRDVSAMMAFYGALLPWRSHVEDMAGCAYHHLLRGEDPVGGMMAMAGEAWNGIPEHWMTYVAVADLDATAARVPTLGGTVLVPPTSIGVGRFSVIRDPQGGTFSLFQPA